MIYRLKDQEAVLAVPNVREQPSQFPHTVSSFKKWREENAKGFTPDHRYSKRMKPLSPLENVHPLHAVGIVETPEEQTDLLEARRLELKRRRRAQKAGTVAAAKRKKRIRNARRASGADRLVPGTFGETVLASGTMAE